MAVATTTPEFFTNVISTFTESDIGLGTIIGSLLFNTLGVAAVASLAASEPVQLDWWPITRDATIYSLNIILLLAFAWDNQVTLIETIIMVTMLFLYFVVIFQNKRIMPKVRWFFEDYLQCCRVSSYSKLTSLLSAGNRLQNSYVPFSFLTIVGLPSSFIEKNFHHVIINQPKPIVDEKLEKKRKMELERTLSKSSIDNSPIFMIYTRDDDDSDGNKIRKSLWHLPPTRTVPKTLWWFYTWPIKFVLTMTIPNPKTYRRLYPLTFLLCIIWIGSNAYLVVWMVTVIGKTATRLFFFVCAFCNFRSFLCIFTSSQRLHI